MLCTSYLLAITILNAVRKTLSIVHALRANKVNAFLSQGPSGFWHGCSTVDVILGYHWLATKTQRFQFLVHILGINMSRAFDTTRRDKLIKVFECFLWESVLQIIRMLLAETTLEPRLKWSKCSTFTPTTGTPQGDSLLPSSWSTWKPPRDLRDNLPQRPREDTEMSYYTAYADDIEFISNAS